MKTINVYRFEELNEKARCKVWENAGIDFSDDYASDYENVLHAFEKVFDIRVYDWRVGNCIYSPYFRNGIVKLNIAIRLSISRNGRLRMTKIIIPKTANA